MRSSASRSGDFDAVLVECVSGPACSGRTCSGIRRARSTRATSAVPTVDAALDRIRYAAPTTRPIGPASRRFSRRIVDDPPAIFLAWSERARAVSTRFDVPAEPGRDILSTLRLWRPLPTSRHAEPQLTHDASDPPHRRHASRCSSPSRRSLPLLAYGFISLLSLAARHPRSVVTGNLNVATRAAEEIRRYVVTQRRHPEGARRRPAGHRPRPVAAGPHPQELRPAVPRIPRDHAVRRSRRRSSPRAASASRASSIPQDAAA